MGNKILFVMKWLSGMAGYSISQAIMRILFEDFDSRTSILGEGVTGLVLFGIIFFATKKTIWQCLGFSLQAFGTLLMVALWGRVMTQPIVFFVFGLVEIAAGVILILKYQNNLKKTYDGPKITIIR